MNADMRRNALRRYIVFRLKLVEYFDLGVLRQELWAGNLKVSTPIERSSRHFADSLRTIQISYLALFIDKNGMNVLDLWSKLFPDLAGDIEKTRTNIHPAWQIIKKFRDKAGFHADQPLAFFAARRAVIEHAPLLHNATEEFRALYLTVVKREHELDDLEDAFAELFADAQKSDRGSEKLGSERPGSLREYLIMHSPLTPE